MKRDFALYQVALKLLLRKGGKILFLRTSDDGKWDIPGGRIDNVEARVPLNKILAREVREELGRHIRYRVGKPLFQFRSYVPSRKVYRFKTVYEGIYLSGKISLSSEHAAYEWIDPKIYRWNGKDFSSAEEYLAFMDYFKKHA